MTTPPDAGFRFDRPAALIAALPALLGFVPEDSLVLAVLEDDELSCVMRLDLSEDILGMCERVATAVVDGPGDSAVAVIVDEDGAACRMCCDGHQVLADALGDALARTGVRLRDVHVVDRVDAGGRWHCADGCGLGGEIDDPHASPVAAAAVLDGRRLYTRRSELQDVVAPTDPVRAAGLRAALLAHAATHGEEDPADQVRHAVAMAVAIARGECPDADDVVRLACALAVPCVRDTLYALAVSSIADEAEALWLGLARTVPFPWRADALVLLGFSTYVRGDGPLTGIAVGAALDGAPEHRMASMLDEALQRGVRPEQIRELGLSGYRVAQRLGVDLPPRPTFGGARPSRP